MDFFHPKTAPKIVSHENVGAADRVAKPGNIGRSGKPKRAYDVHIHDGMTKTRGTNLGMPTTQILDSIPDASNPNALDPTKVGKRSQPVTIHPAHVRHAQFHGVNDDTLRQLGKAVLDAASLGRRK